MNCPKCGAKNEENALFCRCCGAPLQESRQPLQNSGGHAPVPKKEPKMKPGIIIVAAVLAVALVGLLIMTLGGGHCKIEYVEGTAEVLRGENGLKSALQKAVNIYASWKLGDLVDMQYPAARRASEGERGFLDGMGRMAKENGSKVISAEVTRAIRMSSGETESCEDELNRYDSKRPVIQDGYRIRTMIEVREENGREENISADWEFVKIDNRWYLMHVE